jgi:hypothetical protein
VHHVDRRRLLEELGGEMRRRADAGGAEVHLAGIRLGVVDQPFHVLRGKVVVHREDQRRDAGERDRREALHRVVRELALVERRVGRMARDHGEQAVAVGRRLRHQVGAENAVGAGTVVDHDRLAEAGGHLLRHDARHAVGDAAARIRHDPADRLRRIRLG